MIRHFHLSGLTQRHDKLLGVVHHNTHTRCESTRTHGQIADNEDIAAAVRNKIKFGIMSQINLYRRTLHGNFAIKVLLIMFEG